MLFEPVNGYQLRRELMSWRVDEWAHINPGSIYSGLATLARQGLVMRHDLEEGSRQVAVYTTTAEGRSEFVRLFGEALSRVEPLAPLAFNTAVSMAPLVERGEFLALLKKRLAAMDARTDQFARMDRDADPAAVPPHVLVLADLWSRVGQVEHEWLVELIQRVEAGALAFHGEPPGWTPPADDPGWQMSADRERYRSLLGLS